MVFTEQLRFGQARSFSYIARLCLRSRTTSHAAKYMPHRYKITLSNLFLFSLLTHSSKVYLVYLISNCITITIFRLRTCPLRRKSRPLVMPLVSIVN